MLNIRCLQTASSDTYEADIKQLKEGFNFQNNRMRFPTFLKPIDGEKDGYEKLAAGPMVKRRYKYMYFENVAAAYTHKPQIFVEEAEKSAVVYKSEGKPEVLGLLDKMNRYTNNVRV